MSLFYKIKGPAQGQSINTATASWSNINNVGGYDGTFANSKCDNKDDTDTLRTFDYKFKVPDYATVTGVEVWVYRKSSNSNVQDNEVRLTTSSSDPVGDNKASGADWSINTTELKVYGGPTDKWGLTLTPATINNSNFGLRLDATSSTSSSRNVYVDAVHIKVYFDIDDTCCLSVLPV